MILAELVETTPGSEGNRFAAAKSAGLYEEALSVARRSPCDPRTLARAARDFEETNPRFSVGAGLLALHWLSLGYGYEITGADVVFAFTHTMNAAERAGIADETRSRILEIVAGATDGGFVAGVLKRTRAT